MQESWSLGARRSVAQSSHAHLDRERPSAEVTPRDSLMSEPEARGPEDHERHGVARGTDEPPSSLIMTAFTSRRFQR